MKNSIVPLELSPETAPVLGTGPASPAPHSAHEWGYPGEAEPAEVGGMGAKVRRYWAAVKRFWWLVAGLTAIGTAAGVIATQYIKPIYEAQGALWISDVATASSGGPIKNAELLPNGSWLELFKNFAVVDSVVVKRRLWYWPLGSLAYLDSAVLDGIRPSRKTVGGTYTLAVNLATNQYTLSEIRRGVVEQGTLGDSIGRKVGLAWIPPRSAFTTRQTIRFLVAQPRPVALKLLKDLDVAMNDNSNFLRVTLTGHSKWKTADVLNAWMAAFVEKAAELRIGNLNQTSKILETQRAGALANLDAAELALKNFREANSTAPREGGSLSSATGGIMGDALYNDLIKSQTDYEDVHRDRVALDGLAAAARQGSITPEAISAIPAAITSPSLAAAASELVQKESQLRAQRQLYTDDYPAVRKLISDVNELRTKAIPTHAANAAEALMRKETTLLGRIRADSLKLQGIPQRSIEETRLRREVSLAEQMYTALENRYETTKLGAQTSIPDVTILSPALPAASSQRNTIIMLVGLGIFGSLGLGVVLALLLDMIDHRFRYPEQITDELKLSVLGAVPAVPKPGEAADPEATLQSVEAFRGLRLNMHHAFDAPPVMLTISSPGAGDGKSMIASNLALSFADAGYRTLLIDGDIRRGKLHSVFGIERRPGLLDYLAGDAEMQDIVREAPMHAGLTIIPSGTRRHRGPELLTSARLPGLLNAARDKYDVILMDSAPLAAGIDAYALGVATGSMILVMRTAVTDRRVAKAKLKLMERMPVRIIGAVVNAVPAAGLYSEYSYLYGYQPDVDEDRPKVDPFPALQSVDTPR